MILGGTATFMIIPNFSSTKQNAKALQNDSSAPVLYSVFLVAHQKENHQAVLSESVSLCGLTEF